MKKIVTIFMMIATMIMIATTGYAEVEPFGGHAEVSFFEFIENSEITDVAYCGTTAYQEMYFDNGWHIVAECDKDIDNAKSATVHVYDDTCWIVDSYIIENNDEGEQQFWDLMYAIYNGEL